MRPTQALQTPPTRCRRCPGVGARHLRTTRMLPAAAPTPSPPSSSRPPWRIASLKRLLASPQTEQAAAVCLLRAGFLLSRRLQAGAPGLRLCRGQTIWNAHAEQHQARYVISGCGTYATAHPHQPGAVLYRLMRCALPAARRTASSHGRHGGKRGPRKLAPSKGSRSCGRAEQRRPLGSRLASRIGLAPA